MNQGINVIGALRVNLSRKEVREFLAQKELKENVQQMPSAVKMPATGKNIRNHLTKQQQPKKTMHRKQITENNSHSNRDPVDKVQSKYVPDKAVLDSGIMKCSIRIKRLPNEIVENALSMQSLASNTVEGNRKTTKKPFNIGKPLKRLSKTPKQPFKLPPFNVGRFHKNQDGKKQS